MRFETTRTDPQPDRSALEKAGHHAREACRLDSGSAEAWATRGFVLGPQMEEHLRRALIISRGDWSVFVTRPLSAALVLVAAVVLLIVFVPQIAKKREAVFQEETS